MAGGVFYVPISVTLPVSLPQASRLCQWGVCVCVFVCVPICQLHWLRLVDFVNEVGVCVCVCVCVSICQLHWLRLVDFVNGVCVCVSPFVSYTGSG